MLETSGHGSVRATYEIALTEPGNPFEADVPDACAGAGMFKGAEEAPTEEAKAKKKHRRFHLRHKHKQKVEYEGQEVEDSDGLHSHGSSQTNESADPCPEVQMQLA